MDAKAHLEAALAMLPKGATIELKLGSKPKITKGGQVVLPTRDAVAPKKRTSAQVASDKAKEAAKKVAATAKEHEKAVRMLERTAQAAMLAKAKSDQLTNKANELAAAGNGGAAAAKKPAKRARPPAEGENRPAKKPKAVVAAPPPPQAPQHAPPQPHPHVHMAHRFQVRAQLPTKPRPPTMASAAVMPLGWKSCQ